MKIPQNSVLVEIEKIADDQYKFASGLTIFMNTTFKPENYIRIYGTCAAVPGKLTKGDMIKFDPDDYRHIDSIEPEVMIGDTVYFSYHILNQQNLLEFEGKSYYRINYQHILCVVRDKVIIPIGGNVMCEEYFGRGAHVIEVEGRKIYAETSKSGLITNIVKKASEKYAVVKIIGSPLKEDLEIGFDLDDIIAFPNKFGFKNNIEGKEYVFLKYWDVMATIGSVNN